MVRFIEPHILLEEIPENVDKGPKPNTPMQQFYRRTTIFITGCSGFIGKVLTEKLLRSFPELETIYVLMRAKREKSIEDRMDAIFDDVIFHKLRQVCPNFREKIRAVSGDCSLPGLGLSDEQRHLLTKNVDIVFHGAATVKFTETLRVAVAINVCGTREVLSLAKRMNKLKAIVHVSTAYSNFNQTTVDEKFYDPPMPYQQLLDVVNGLSDQILEDLTPRLLGKWPNTYSFTKAVAEDVIRQEGSLLPIVIMRPSIVIAIRNDPLPGWIDNFYGPTGAMLAIHKGVMRTMPVDSNAVADVVPVDMVVNTMISAAWDVGTKLNRSPEEDKIPIYNFVSYCEKPLSWGEFVEKYKKNNEEVPMIDAMWYISFLPVISMKLYWVLEMFLHCLPAFLLESLNFLQFKNIKYKQLYLKIREMNKLVGPFSTRTWKFSNSNVQALWLKLSGEDQKDFMFDMKQLDWDDFFFTYVRGCRVFLAKDNLSSVPQALVRWKRLYWIHQVFKITLLLLLTCTIWHISKYL